MRSAAQIKECQCAPNRTCLDRLLASIPPGTSSPARQAQIRIFDSLHLSFEFAYLEKDVQTKREV
jgi:hypothetical protein